MKIYIRENYEGICQVAADLIEIQIKSNPGSVLGLATGSTPIGVYSKLIDKYNQGLSFKDIVSFNLDE